MHLQGAVIDSTVDRNNVNVLTAWMGSTTAPWCIFTHPFDTTIAIKQPDWAVMQSNATRSCGLTSQGITQSQRSTLWCVVSFASLTYCMWSWISAFICTKSKLIAMCRMRLDAQSQIHPVHQGYSVMCNHNHLINMVSSKYTSGSTYCALGLFSE